MSVPTGTVHVLCVDDQETSRRVMVAVLARYLRDHFAEVRTRAFDGSEAALEFLRSLNRGARRIDLLVTDLHMPGMDGIELIRRMRMNSFTEAVPTILVTADEAAHAQQDAASGVPVPLADAVLPKPMSRDGLARVMPSMIARMRAGT